MDKWQSVGQSQHNVLNEFYKHPERFAYTFQNYVFVTRMLQVGAPLHLLTGAALCALRLSAYSCADYGAALSGRLCWGLLLQLRHIPKLVMRALFWLDLALCIM